MTRSFFPPTVAMSLVMLVSLLICQPSPAQDAALPEKNDNPAQRFYNEFAETAQALAFITLTDAQPFTLQQEPLMKFASEGTTFGSVYVWHDADQRLAMIGTIGSLPIQNVNVEFVELHLLKPAAIQPVPFTGFPAKTWTPEIEDLTLRPLSNAPAVAAAERSRLTQMRNLARQFAAEMTHDGRTNQLRLLPQPLYRYADSTQKRDGALFAFVWDTGTDPELILRIESVPTEGNPQWHYQPIRFTWRQLALNHNDVTVWQVEEFRGRDAPKQTTPYITGLTRPLP
ncbi:MAG: hypothetical protein R3C59_12455 [Planctomycetaceae bacterium]